MPRLIFLLVLFAACGSKPATEAPRNVRAGSSEPEHKPVAMLDTCAAQKTCVACIGAPDPSPDKGSCHWDIDKQTCGNDCALDAKNCLVVGAKNIGDDRAREVCGGMTDRKSVV